MIVGRPSTAPRIYEVKEKKELSPGRMWRIMTKDHIKFVTFSPEVANNLDESVQFIILDITIKKNKWVNREGRTLWTENNILNQIKITSWDINKVKINIEPEPPKEDEFDLELKKILEE